MAEQLVTRPARQGEAARLAVIKAEYVRSLYRGFLSDDFLRQITPTFYLPEVQRWMRDGDCRVSVLELDGQAEGYAVYGVDPSERACGFIREMAINPVYSRQEKNELAQYVMRELAEMGFAEIHTWVLRDNFRVRFLFESMGFRTDGVSRTEKRENTELQVARYVYRPAGRL